MYCKNCGSNINNYADRCPICGTYTQTAQPVNTIDSEDKHSFWWGLLSFLSTLTGFVLYAIWHREMPKRAKSCLIGAILSFVLWIAFVVVSILFWVIIIVALYNPVYPM